MADVVFQMAFCMITTAIITGAVAGRVKFGAVCAFTAVWTVVVYPPLAHMVWGGEGSLVGGMIGALDFAGGDVVHISSGLTGLVLCVIAGKRKRYAVMSYRPHNVPFVALVGETEMAEGRITLKNMTTGEQQSLTIEEAVKAIKG